jgi:hypothetical protein
MDCLIYLLKTQGMKNILLFFVVVFITIAACNPLKPDKAQAVNSSFAQTDTITADLADSMIVHYFRDTTEVPHNMNSLILQTSLYNSDLYEIFKIDSITRIKLLLAAYLHNDSVVSRRDSVTVLLQLKHGYHSSYTYYNLTTLGSGRICPPPNGCTVP